MSLYLNEENLPNMLLHEDLIHIKNELIETAKLNGVKSFEFSETPFTDASNAWYEEIIDVAEMRFMIIIFS